MRRYKLLSNPTQCCSFSGHIESKWQASIKTPRKKEDLARFIVLPETGTLEPGAKTYLNIYFVPVDTKKIERTLHIEINGSLDPILMELIGQGLESNLKVETSESNFSPTLNYFKNTLTFTVQNVSEIPIEFYFPTLDDASQQERNLTEIYLKHKNLKFVFAPLRSAGNGLPNCFQTTYDGLVDNLRKKICEKEIVEASETVEASDTDLRNSKSHIEVGDPLIKFPPNELNRMLLDYIAADGFSSGETSSIHEMDDSTDRFEILEPCNETTQEEIERKAVLFIFHGAPNTDYYKAASQVGIALSIPVYGIDGLIIESLVEDKDPAASEISEIINESFQETIDADLDQDLLESLKDETNEYDNIFAKILNIIEPKSKKGSKKRSRQEKGSKTSSEKSLKRNRKAGDCFLNITSDALVDLLKAKLKTFPYLVIESLTSRFIPKQNQALYILLRAAGCIAYINLVLLSYTVNDYVKNWESAQKNIETGGNSEREKDQIKKTTKIRPVLPAQASASGRAGKASTKVDSERLSKTSNVQGERTKKILLTLHKHLKAELEEFEALRAELVHVAQYWDKQNAVLKKPFSSGPQKKDSSIKDSARTNRNSSFRKSISAIALGDTSDTGIYLCLVLNSTNTRLVDYPKMIRNFVKNNVELQRIVKEIEENKKKIFLESETFFTVITNPTRSKNEFSSVFSIRNFKGSDVVYPVRTRSKSGSSIGKLKHRRTSKGSRRRSSETKSNQDKKSFVKSETDAAEFSSRTILSPGDLVKYQVTFCPLKCGNYKYIYTLEPVKNSSKRNYQIKFNAVCEYPKINLNPEVMFPKTLENYREKASYDHFVYIEDQKIFDFGSIIAGSSPDKCLLYSTTMRLRNDSSSNCDITITLSNDVFTIDPTNFIMAPESECLLNLSAKSTNIGTQVAQMYISIRNNPQVESIMLACSPCKLEFSVQPRTITFDKVPVSYSAKRVVRLTNTSPINLRWELVDPGWAHNIFELSRDRGTIDLYSTCDIVVKFSPTEELSIPKKVLPIKVFDVNSVSNDPCCLESLTINADSVLYNLDLDGHIDYGEIKGGVLLKRLLPITNKAKCEVILKIEMVNNPLESNNFVREYFKVQPLLLNVGSQKTENLSIILHSKCNFSAQNLLIFVVSMVESIQTGHVIKSYKVTISATCFMPNFTICPLSRVNFGYVPVRNTKKQIMEISNRGKFSFNFNLINYAKFSEKAIEIRKEKKTKDVKVDTKNENKANSEKATRNKSDISKGTSKTDKKKQIAMSKLEAGSFSISPSSGIVEPNETVTIEVEITPDEVKQYDEKILIHILEIENMQKQKVVNLQAVGCEPKINFRDFEKVFAEQYFVKKIEEFIPPRNVDGCCIFSSSERMLYFELVCVETSFSTKLHLTNIGYATSQLTARIDESISKQAFSVTPISQTLDPHSTQFVKVTFSPRSLDPITGSLEITYNATSDNKLTISLHGRACLPQIQLLKPLTDSNEVSLELEPICAGHRKEARVSFKNISEIKCKVILELSSSNDVFSIVPVGSTLQMLNVQDSSRYMVNLLVDDIAEFDVICKPKERTRNQVTLSLHTVYNPYEVNKVLITADSYDDNIVLEGLNVIILNPSQGSQECQNSVRKILTEYNLNFGYKVLNKIYKKTFKIRNRSNKHTYKFILHSSVVLFVPETGHLNPRAFKEITVIFKSMTPVSLQREEIGCIVTQIEYLYPDEHPISWDDRLKFAQMNSSCDLMSYFSKSSSVHSLSSNESLSIEESSSSLIEDSTASLEEEEDVTSEYSKTTNLEGDEPEITTLPDSMEMIPLILTVFADYSRYKCETKAIQFADTYINEENIKNVEVENIGNVPLLISWTINNRARCKSSTSQTCIPKNKFWEEVSTRSASSCELLSNFSFESDPSVPIVVYPGKIIIEPGSTGIINLRFLPKTEDNFEAILQSNVDTLDPTLDKINIELKAKSLPIPFYFEMEDKTTSSTVASLEFDNIGVVTESARKLFLVNPNDDCISFEIIPKDTRDFSQFICGIPRGTITGKTKNFTTFYFRSPMIGSFKEEYLVKIPEKKLQKSILLLGLCREPKVYFNQKTVALRATVPNVKSIGTIKLCNDEKFPVLFRFVKKTLNSENQQEKLEMFPSVGKLQPEGEQNIRCTFTTANIVSASFYIKCMIEKRKSPLNLVVSATSLRLIPLVKYSTKNEEIVILKENEVNLMDLGSTYKGRKDIVKFEIANTNEIGMSYAWKFDTSYVSHIFNISTDKQKESIESNKVSTVNLSFDAVGSGILKNFKILLQIMYGPEYIIQVNAVSDKPSFSFSFNSYNFGYCLKQSKETNYYTTLLIFKNLDVKTILVENLFEKTNFLSVEFTSSNVPPGETRQIAINFFPQTVGSYKTKIVFLIDGIKNMIGISGEAVTVNLELCNLKDRFIDFGEVRLGNVKKYHVGVFNNSPAKVDLHFNFYENLLMHQRKIEKLDQVDMKIPAASLPEGDKQKNIGKRGKLQDPKTKAEKPIGDKNGEKGKQKKEELLKQAELQIEDLEKENLKKIQEARLNFLKCFVIEPNNFKNVPPKGKRYFNIIFQPNNKMNFEEKIYLEIQDYMKPFFIIKGSSLIAKFSLEKKEASFIGVISGHSSSQLINVKNTGDLAGSFEWQIDDKRNLFVIEPKQGFVLPKNEVQTKITFSPKQEKCEFRVKAKCIIKEFKETLTLTMKGNSVRMPEPTSTVTMKCNVREQVVESVMVNNNTSNKWLLQCDISNDVFSTTKEIVALPLIITPIMITYYPKKMTTVKPDEADLFIKIPDGSGLLYKLEGTAEPPLLEKRIEKEIRCKQNFHAAIPIENWLNVKQTFEVTTEVLSPISTKTLYRIFGFKNVELKGREKKNYNWGAYVVNEGLIEFRVTFKTSEGEYIFFEISLKVLPSEPKENIVFNTRVREPVTMYITLENPVDAPVTYLLESNGKNLIFPKFVKLEPYTTAKTDVTYSPIHVETVSTIITAKCDELGTYTYMMEMEAIAPKIEECVVFVSEFGGKATQGLAFENTFERTVEFSYHFDDEHFFMEKCGAVAPGDSAKIIISFEPCSLGHYETKLSLSSTVAGEYIYPLKGESIPPKPKGPFLVKLNHPVTIHFKNPFEEDKQFKIKLSPNAFRCDYNEEEIVLSKRLARFEIYRDPETESDLSTYSPGKLIVYSADLPEVQWKYYLEMQSH
ncbi:unnamed protein product [Ceutorhynchus assimilis]|uniref:Hydrocephalus-inducing protein n=1 Tax=Ceutorhynchus assimilis TaxID=467358 RepID=A0A9P0DHL0_9CUCU|nr:unnamed protein product [Ceutorhynchus assimilis]